MSREGKTPKKHVLPLLPLRGLTVFPHMIIHFDVGRVKSIKALEEAMLNNQLIFLVAQKDAMNDSPEKDEIYSIGTISRIKQLLKLPGDTIRVLVEGVCRAKINKYEQDAPFAIAEVEEQWSIIVKKDEIKSEALRRQLATAFEEYSKLNNKVSPETVFSILSIEDVNQMSDMVAANLFVKLEQKQEILQQKDVVDRMNTLIEVILKEVEIIEIEKKINVKVRQQIDKVQKEYYLREQLKAIQNELGDKDGVLGEVEEYKKKLSEMKVSEEVENKLLRELDRLLKTPSGSAEGSVIRTYVEWILDLPWDKSTKDVINLKKARTILEKDHYGLEKVKERIIEYLAVRKMKNELSGPIICLVGPPGVGKTSIAKSIAEAVNRKYVRMSMGGVRDEAEIRGHRKTYVGAMPGRIIAALKQAGSNNPLILLDEIDKMSSDYKGDPSSAMLEVLDAEQNFSFRDHYLELPFDLSNVLFLTTANSLETIPRALLDRLEVINISGYTEEEKAKIAKKYLIPKQLENHGLTPNSVKINQKTIRDIINYYTREAGVRNLERQVAKVCRKSARYLIENVEENINITSSNLHDFLGIQKYRYGISEGKDEVGIVTGLAWTPVGGDTLQIEVSAVPGKGNLDLTGQLGDVMKESAKAAISYIRYMAKQYGIEEDFYSKYDIHVHIPEGAIPKDGPSAGITLFTAIVSFLTGIPVKKNVAMTGEITLRGRVLPIGGLKEKVLAAHRAGIDTIIIPFDNKKDLEDIPDNIKSKINFVIVSQANTVLSTALSMMPSVKTLIKQQKQQNDIYEEDGTPLVKDITEINGSHDRIEQ